MSRLKKLFGGKSESSSPKMIYGYVHNGKAIPDTRVGSSTTIISPENLTLHENVFIGQYNFIEASNMIEIGEGCQITNYISVLSHSSHISIRLHGRDYRNVKDPIGYVRGSVEIGKYSFIGPHSTIMPGTKLGKGSIVSAYSLVKGEFPDFAVIAGNPAKQVGDTRDMDKKYLEDYPEIVSTYEQWAKE